MEDVEIDKYPDGSYGICFCCKEYIRYLNPYAEGVVKLEIKLESDSKEIEDERT